MNDPMQSPQKSSLSWQIIEGLLQKQSYDEAFTMILRQVYSTQNAGSDFNNDSIVLIKALDKVGCKFSFLSLFNLCLCPHEFSLRHKLIVRTFEEGSLPAAL